ncbi:MAG: ABC transporter permease [Planctomycetota bacterium]|nr:ABC transporter permease [Planctomycetota bacterium]
MDPRSVPIQLLGTTGRSTLVFLGHVGQLSAMTATALNGIGRKLRGKGGFGTSALMEEMNESGVRSIPIVCLVSALIGTILVLQTAYQLERYGQKNLVAAGVAVSLTRELGPLMTAIVVTGRVGAGFAAQIGTMKVSEELLALRTMAINPVYFLVSQRLFTLLILLPCLTIFADFVGILGGYLVGITAYGINPNIYIQNTFLYMTSDDIISGIIKSGVFALIITMVSCHLAFRVTGGAAGVGKATRLAVVSSIVLVIVADAIFTAILTQ